MIKPNSALLDRKTRAQILADLERRQVIVLLSEAGLTNKYIAFALNCSQTIIALAFLADRGLIGGSSRAEKVTFPEQIDFKGMPRHQRGLLLYRPPKTEAGRTRERRELAGHLEREIVWWLCEFDLSNEQRQAVIEDARAILKTTPFKYSFNLDRVLTELMSIWRPKSSEVVDRDLPTFVGLWLASWIGFWTTGPAIRNMALDLAFAHFGVEPKAA